MTDYLGIFLTITIILFIILVVWSRIQGDRIIDILAEIRDFMKGEI